MPWHRQKTTELQPDDVVIRFSPEARESLLALEETVHLSSHFDTDIRRTLQSLANGNPISLSSLVGALPLIIKETMRHIHETGDEKAQSALLELNVDLCGRSATSKPISLGILQKGRDR